MYTASSYLELEAKAAATLCPRIGDTTPSRRGTSVHAGCRVHWSGPNEHEAAVEPGERREQRVSGPRADIRLAQVRPRPLPCSATAASVPSKGRKAFPSRDEAREPEGNHEQPDPSPPRLWVWPKYPDRRRLGTGRANRHIQEILFRHKQRGARAGHGRDIADP